MGARKKALFQGRGVHDPGFVQTIVDLYAHDFNRYRVEVLGMKSEPWQNTVGDDLVKYRRVGVQSGHGIGKTSFAAAAIHWFLATRPRPQIVATANTEVQLASKLWRELNKINQQALNKEWFEWSATKFAMVMVKTAFAQAVTWSENNPDAFAGTHEQHVLGVFDEGSGIPQSIWTTFAGAMTTPGSKWLATGNPIENQGYFYEICNGALKWQQPGDEKQGKWRSHTIGSAESSFVDRGWLDEMKATLSEDDYRVRVLGMPPLQALDQFIPNDLIAEASKREVVMFERWPLILGVDVARQGNDKSVIVPRRGLIVPNQIRGFSQLSLKQLAAKVAHEIEWWRTEHDIRVRAVFVEGGGSIGWGVIEELWELGYDQVFDVNPGEKSSEPELYANKRCEMWGRTKEWLDIGGKIPPHADLMQDLRLPKKKPDAAMRLRLESKDEMRRRVQKSPDFGDALALTFAMPVELEPEKKKDRWSEAEPVNTEPSSWRTM